MRKIYLNIGSNINKCSNIKSGLTRLEEHFGSVVISSVYESASVGFSGDSFYNLAAMIESDLPIQQLSDVLKKIEDEHGRNREDVNFKGRTLDIDIVLFGDSVGSVDGIELPRAELYYHSFVLGPMAELAGSELDPKTKQSYSALWENKKGEIDHPLSIVEDFFNPVLED